MTSAAGGRAAPSILHGPPLADEPGLGPLTLPGFFLDVTERYARREALVMHEDGAVMRWSYADLRERALEVARSLIAIGIGKDSRVGVMMTNRPEFLSAFFGVALAGGLVVPISTFSTLPELDHLLAASAVSALLFEGRVLKRDFAAMLGELEPAIATALPGALHSTRYPYLRHLAVVGEGSAGAMEGWSGFLARGASIPTALVEPRGASVLPTDAGGLFFSSGSTAKPKGILNAQRGIAIQFWRWRRLLGFDFGSDVRAWTPNGFFWSGNCTSVMGATLACGGSMVLQSTFVPDEALRLMEAERVNYPVVWPHQAKLLEEAPNWAATDLSAVRYLDPANPMVAHPTITLGDWCEPRWSYGSTETFTITTSFPSGTPEAVAGASHGAALPGNTIRIVDPITGAVVPHGDSGEIVVKGPTLMMGYLGVPIEETLDADGYYRTGDGGHIDDRDRLVFEGRLSTVIKTGGANVSPLEIDKMLETFPGVKVARTVGVPHETLGEMVVACIVPLEGANLEADSIHAFARERLASYKTPRRYLFLREEELPLTGTAKVKSGELRTLAAERLRADASAGGVAA